VRQTSDRVQTVITLLGCAPLQSTDLVLDIGIGSGEISAALAKRTSCVVGTGLNFTSYGIRATDLQDRGVIPLESISEYLPFAESTFNVVVMSHILEHTPNVGWTLGEVRRVLRSNGLLCILVPPSEPVVAGGHISVGWNIGQLLYVLALNGFDTHEGNFIRYGYNVCGFVRRDERPLPALKHDSGDLRALEAEGRFPVPIVNADNSVEAFFGDLSALNWPWLDIFLKHDQATLVRRLRNSLPRWLRVPMGRTMQRLGSFLVHGAAPVDAMINPKELHL
jgi:SAM-dependent methyltransferase